MKDSWEGSLFEPYIQNSVKWNQLLVFHFSLTKSNLVHISLLEPQFQAKTSKSDPETPFSLLISLIKSTVSGE